MRLSKLLVAALLVFPASFGGVSALGFAASVEADPAIARALGSLTVDPGSSLEIRGSSTLHPIHMRVDGASFVLGGSKDLGADGPALPSLRELIGHIVAKSLLSRFSLSIPADSIDPDEKAMKTDLLKTLKAGQFPAISYDLDRLSPVSGSGTDRTIVHATGTLSIGGVMKRIALDLVVTILPEGLDIAGTTRLLLSDFDLKPPVLLGLIRVADPVDITFDLRVRLGPR